MQSILDYFASDGAEWLQMVAEHLQVSALALAIAVLVAVPAGILCSRSALADRLATGIAGVLRIVPSLAVLIICVPYLGVGTLPAVVALTVLAIPPILINTAVAFRNVPVEMIEAARGLGMSPTQMFWRIQVPLAFPVAFSGIRTASIEVIASASLAAYIGAGGLGVLIYTGIGAMRNDLLWIGGLSVAALSLLTSRLLAAADNLVRQRLHLA
ncbi:ABC transporter permease [Enorma phocaeensis]|uniref:ABC transporter permease n=1 Tax=Enorma phocaeensis TaxID=1871019 RepID=A0ABT7V6N0_9ACTN|nr:ABC transporter permease [Enorma phocaeensis]MDM8274147.1 ABC transporter permease [Enorma phocaeensis]